jgi:hypothetical protein
MIDLMFGLIGILKADLGVKALAGSKVYGDEIPREQIDKLPSKMIAIVQAGGVETNQSSSTISARYDIWCYGESKYEAGKLARAVYDAAKAVSRITISAMLIHSISLSGGAMPYRDIDTGWPAIIRSVSVIADDRIIG